MMFEITAFLALSAAVTSEIIVSFAFESTAILVPVFAPRLTAGKLTEFTILPFSMYYIV